MNEILEKLGADRIGSLDGRTFLYAFSTRRDVTWPKPKPIRAVFFGWLCRLHNLSILRKVIK